MVEESTERGLVAGTIGPRGWPVPQISCSPFPEAFGVQFLFPQKLGANFPLPSQLSFQTDFSIQALCPSAPLFPNAFLSTPFIPHLLSPALWNNAQEKKVLCELSIL